MRSTLFAAAVLVALLSGSMRAEESAADAMKQIEGTWLVKRGEANGQEVTDENVKSVKLSIFGGFYTLSAADHTESGSISVDPAQTPRAMDLVTSTGPDAGQLTLAIYEVQGETMKICASLNSGPRPTKFEAPVDSGIVLIIFQREKQSPAEKPE